MTSKEKYKVHIRGKLDAWIVILEDALKAHRDDAGKDYPEALKALVEAAMVKVIKAMRNEKTGQEVPEVVGE